VSIRRSATIPPPASSICEGSPGDPHRGFYFHLARGTPFQSARRDRHERRTSASCPGTFGAGFCATASPRPASENCIFLGNIAYAAGGGLGCRDSSPVVRGCLFLQNRVESGTGGGGMCWYSGAPVLEDCTFRENSGPAGGAVRCDESSAQIRRCIFRSKFR